MGKSSSAPVSPPTHGTVYVAKNYPTWQATVLDTLRQMYNGDPKTIVDNKEVSVQLGKVPDLKKYMKKVMPFVAFTKEKVVSNGLSALDTSLPWCPPWVWRILTWLYPRPWETRERSVGQVLP